MTNREKLKENYEDAAFALLMDELAESEGARYIEENERLRQDPSAAVPEEFEKSALQFIDREFSRRSKVHTGQKALRFVLRVAIAAVIAVLLFGIAFALSETVRIETLNFLTRMDRQIATWQFVQDEDMASTGQQGKVDIIADWIPEGYDRQPQIVTGPYDTILDCTNDAGGLIRVSVHEGENLIHTLDLEDAEYFSDITVQGQQGMLRIKDGFIRITWPYFDTDLVVSVVSSDIDSDTILEVAESVRIVR